MKQDRKYCKEINYSGKWVLYRNYSSSDYTSIFVIEEKDGILKYVYENNPNNILYEDVEEFEYYDRFFINPIQNNRPNIILGKKDVSIGQSEGRKDEDEWYYYGDYPLIGGPYKGPKIDPTPRVTFKKPNSSSDSTPDTLEINCDHEKWCYSDLLSMPPIHTRKCVKCGREEYRLDNETTWKKGRGY